MEKIRQKELDNKRDAKDINPCLSNFCMRLISTEWLPYLEILCLVYTFLKIYLTIWQCLDPLRLTQQKYYTVVGLSHKMHFLTVLEAIIQIRIQCAYFLLMSVFLAYRPLPSSQREKVDEGERKILMSCYKTTNLIWRPPPSRLNPTLAMSERQFLHTSH